MDNFHLTVTWAQALARPRHDWRIYPFGEIVARDATNHRPDRQLKIWLEGTENEIYKSWQEMANVEPRLAEFGLSEPLVNDFLKHVHELAETPTHLYYIYQHDDVNT
jgi:hypothetical protein